MAVGSLVFLALLAVYAGSVWSHEIWSNEILTQTVEKISGQIVELKVASSELAGKVDKLRESLAAKEKKSAFLAYAEILKYQTFRKDSPLRFGKVIFNIGSDYNPSTGIFTARYSGIYVFSFQLFPDRTGRNVMADVMKNGFIVLRNRVGNVGGKNEETLTGSTIQQAEPGDRFWITLREGAGAFWGDHHTFFSGALVSRN